MFNVTFYTFSKIQTSTAIPSTAGTVVTCTAKAPVDIINPTIQLQFTGAATANPVSYNYCYIQSFSRYYWVNNWRNVGPLWECDLVCDVLASWRSSIGSQTIYVYRSANQFDSRVKDTLYPTIARQNKLNISVPKVWTIGGANERGALSGSGVFVIGVMSRTQGTTYYALTPDDFIAFIDSLFADQYYNTVLSTFGATEYPEAKVAVNPLQYITMCKFCPIGVIDSGYWGIRYQAVVASITVGVVATGTYANYSAYKLTSGAVPSANSFSIYDITVTAANFLHPQSNPRGNWLNYSPFTKYELFYPPFGLLEIDPVEVSSHTYLRIRLSLDVRTCMCTLDVQVYDTSANIRTINRLQGSFGVDVPLSNIVQPGFSTMQLVGNTVSSLFGAAGSVVSGNIGGAIGSIANTVNSAVGAAVEGQIPHVSTFGGVGNTAALDGTPELYVTHWYVADDDLTDKGRPLMSTRQISLIPGYIMGDADNISIACTEQELAQIKQAVQGGFFYE